MNHKPAAKVFPLCSFCLAPHWSWWQQLQLGKPVWKLELHLFSPDVETIYFTRLLDWSVWSKADTSSRAGRGKPSRGVQTLLWWTERAERPSATQPESCRLPHPQCWLYLWSCMNSVCVPHFILFKALQNSIYGRENWLSNSAESPNSRFRIWTLVSFMLWPAKEDVGSEKTWGQETRQSANHLIIFNHCPQKFQSETSVSPLLACISVFF